MQPFITPQIAAYHKKLLLERAKNKLKLFILVWNLILLAWKTTPRSYTTQAHLSQIDVNIGVTILLEVL